MQMFIVVFISNLFPLCFNITFKVSIYNVKGDLKTPETGVHFNLLKYKHVSYTLTIIYMQLKILDKKLAGNFHFGKVKGAFNDPDIMQQWFYVKSNNSQVHLSHNLDTLWRHSINGLGIIIGIIDGGIDVNHKDLEANHKEDLSYNFLLESKIIVPNEDDRPTKWAGLISAASNNSLCGVGAAPYSKFVNLQVYGDEPDTNTNIKIAKALIHENHLIHIYLLNWKIKDQLNINQPLMEYIIVSLRSGMLTGRGGKGSIFVSRTGNSKKTGNNCAFNRYLQRPEVLVFGAISPYGKVSPYSEQCNAVLAVALATSGNRLEGKMYTTNRNNICKNSSSRTHAAASISAGIIALVLSQNPALSVRQIIMLIALTSYQYDSDAIRNAVGFWYSNSFGFGMLNAEKLIQSSRTSIIEYMRNEHMCLSCVFNSDWLIESRTTRILYIYSSGCLNSSYCVTEIEQIFATFSIITRKRNTVTIYLISPSGTKFAILIPRPFDDSRNGFHRWKLKLMGYFGEKAIGLWKVILSSENNAFHLLKFWLTFRGTCVNPTLNVVLHENTKNLICLSECEISQDLYNRICGDSSDQIEYRYNQDRLSFTQLDFPDIIILNRPL